MFQLPCTSSASRSVFRYRIRRSLVWKSPHLTFSKPWNPGLGGSGRRVLRSRASLLHKTRILRINYNYSTRRTSFISNFVFLPYKNKLATLIRYSHGGLSYQIATEHQKLLSFFYFRYFYDSARRGTITFSTRLIRLPNLAKVCLMEVVPGRGAQYCRSSGTISKILKIDRKNDVSLIRLPSGRSKLFSIYSFASLGRVLFKENRNFLNSKAGYWRGFGFKPTVRGVAMNPVDHPHGGRTNSIRYPRTPWGKTAKYK